ncbi:hypothetical protein SAMN05216312_12248 [Cohnella sp. OV330]|uniref:hypothetical protein n=1 Tax=Cohnella sp. OV330 TaxID=1855288 RepID=UPI0008E289DA|nr:hypothetical protein [Cohnella sp. OV330]SFB62720.1 hypothetical protein SAMN05216312_12248 [Cohnella sp. OV330]
MDLNKLANAALEQIHNDGTFAQIVRKHVEKTVESTVSDVLGSYSDFAKSLKTQLKELFAVNLDKLGIPSYNTLVLKAVKEKLDQVTHIQGTERIKEEMDRLLADVKPEYKLSELINKWKADANEDREHDGENFSYHNDGTSYSSTWIHFDPEPGKDKYECDYKVLVREDGTLSALRIGDEEIKTKTIMWGLHGIGNDLFKIYAHGSRLIIDENRIDTYYDYD